MPEWLMPTHSPFVDASTVPPAANGSAMDTLYRAALGPVRLPRYLALFERFDQTGRTRAGWNPAASLATLNWMLLHHLWTAALIYVALVEGLALLIFGVGRPLLHWPEQVKWGLMAAFGLFAIALPGLFGDALLHSEIRKRIARALVVAHTIPETCELLARQASSWRRLTWIALANLLLFSAIALASVLVPPDGWGGTQAVSPPMASGMVQTATPPQPGASPPAAEPLAPAAPTTSNASSELAADPMPSAPTSEAEPSTSEPRAQTPPVEPTSAPTATVDHPPSTQGTERTAEPPLPEQRQADKQRAKPIAAAPDVDVASTVAVLTSNASAPATKPTPAREASAPASNSVPLGSARGYYLNVGLFAEEANARRTHAKLLNANLPAFRQTFSTQNGERTRVRAGPFETAAEAQKAATQIRSMQLEAVMYRQRG